MPIGAKPIKYSMKIVQITPLALLLLSASIANASTPFTIGSRTSDFGTGNAIYQSLSSAADNIETQINTGFLSDSSRLTFLNSMAEANVSPTHLIAIDRNQSPNRYSVSLGAQVGLNAGSAGSPFSAVSANNSLPAIGLGAQLTASIGLQPAALGLNRLGPLDPKRSLVAINFGMLSPTYGSFSGSVFNLGTHLRYKIVEEKAFPAFNTWRGIDLITGLGYSKLTGTVSGSLTQSSTTTVTGGGNSTMSTTLNYDLGLQSTNWSVPVEVSTGFTLLGLFSVNLGGGLDFNFGTSKLTGGGSGPITASSTASGAGAVANLFSGTATIDLNVEPYGSPSSVIGHGSLGTQFNLGVFKIFTQGAYFSNNTVGLASGLRVLF